MSLPIPAASFITENEKLTKTRQNFQAKRGGPYTKAERRARIEEVYKLHIIHGWPSTRIAETMKVNRHTISDDLKQIYRRMYNEFASKEEHIFITMATQLDRLNAQRTRLLELLDNTKPVEQKLTIERLIFDIDAKLAHIGQTFYTTQDRITEALLERLNMIAKEQDLQNRWISRWDIMKSPIKKFDRIMRIMEEP